MLHYYALGFKKICINTVNAKKEFCRFFKYHKWSVVSSYVDEIETSLEANKIRIQLRNTDDNTVNMNQS